MTNWLASPKDFWAGWIYVALGTAILWIGADYRFGSAGRMGPGYFPKVLAWLLIAIGTIALARAFIVKGAPIGKLHWRAIGSILLACALFGWLLPRLGLGVALLVLGIVSATASREFRFDLRAMLGLLAVVILCAVVFVKGLGVPMPLWGTWLEPFVAELPSWAR
jgi:hypothetical protein